MHYHYVFDVLFFKFGFWYFLDKITYILKSINCYCIPKRTEESVRLSNLLTAGTHMIQYNNVYAISILTCLEVNKKKLMKTYIVILISIFKRLFTINVMLQWCNNSMILIITNCKTFLKWQCLHYANRKCEPHTKSKTSTIRTMEHRIMSRQYKN